MSLDGMTTRDALSLLWPLPPLAAAVVAGVMPDTFLDSPYTTIPHEAAFLVRGWIIFGAFGYIVLVAAIRGVVFLSNGWVTGAKRGFPVLVVDSAGQIAG